MNATSDIVQKLWNLCHVLRDDGISYLQYVTELTYLLFLKMMQETGAEDTQLPEGKRWDDLTSCDGLEQLNFYRALLLGLGQETSRRRVQAIFANAQSDLNGIIGFPYVNRNLRFLVISGDLSGNQLSMIVVVVICARYW
ncbi:MAG: type I restriction-modification system subunit M N-terminal domain-containing protein [Leptolyngbyaceae bacterium]|nr:type I restriction-modification system subunit M N-terminal domain-containing protein [Leptolyngbyaceae bacterium]